MHMKKTGTFAGSFNTIPDEVNSPKWVLLFCIFIFYFFFFSNSALLSGTHTNSSLLVFWETSDLVVNTAGGVTLRGSGRVDDRHSCAE